MASRWANATLGDVITLKRGYDLPSQDRKSGPYPVVSSSGITGCHIEAKARGPGVVTGRYGTLGKVHYIDEDFWPLNTTLYVQDFKGSDPRFISYLLRGLNFQSYSDKSSVPGLNRNHLHTEPVYLPSDFQEQRAIAGTLGALDDKIELNLRINRNLEAIARAIFRAWFIDFEPVKAKSTGATAFRGMPQDAFDQVPDYLTEREAGPIPGGWEHVAIGDLVEVVGGGTPSTKNPEFWEGGEYPFCTPKDMSRLTSPVLLGTERHLTTEGVERVSSNQLPVGTVLLSSRAPIGYLAIAETPVSVNQGIIAMVTGDIPNTYVLLWTESSMEEIKAHAGGSTFAEISKRSFRPIPALRPPPKLLSAFDAAVRPLYRHIASNLRENRALTQIRDIMLPELLSGNVRLCL